MATPAAGLTLSLRLRAASSREEGHRTHPPKQNPTARDALRGENWDNGGISLL
ncbi:hypothetical protein [Nostoc sp.]